MRNLQRALELDPRNPEIIRALADTYLELRRHNEAEQLLSIAALPKQALIFYAKQAACYLARGDARAVAVFAQVPPNSGPSGFDAYYRFTAALYLREYDIARQVIAAGPARIPIRQRGRSVRTRVLKRSSPKAEQKNEEAQAACSATRAALSQSWGETPEDPARRSVLARIRRRAGPQRRGHSQAARRLRTLAHQ